MPCLPRMHEAAGLISIEGSLEGLPEENRQGVDNGDGGGNVPMKRQPGPSEVDAAATATATATAKISTKKATKKAKSIEKAKRSDDWIGNGAGISAKG